MFFTAPNGDFVAAADVVVAVADDDVCGTANDDGLTSFTSWANVELVNTRAGKR